METIAITALRARLADVHGDTHLEALAGRVAAGELDPYAASDALLSTLTEAPEPDAEPAGRS